MRKLRLGGLNSHFSKVTQQTKETRFEPRSRQLQNLYSRLFTTLFPPWVSKFNRNASFLRSPQCSYLPAEYHGNMDLRGKILDAGEKNVEFTAPGLGQAVMMVPHGSQRRVVLTLGPQGQTFNPPPASQRQYGKKAEQYFCSIYLKEKIAKSLL